MWYVAKIFAIFGLLLGQLTLPQVFCSLMFKFSDFLRYVADCFILNGEQY